MVYVSVVSMEPVFGLAGELNIVVLLRLNSLLGILLDFFFPS